MPIAGCEPSCVLTLIEEYPRLVDGPATKAISEQTRLVEDLLVEAIDDGDLTLDAGSTMAGRRIVYHGHCHQKAIVGLDSTIALLRRIPGATVDVLDAGCCGMAGSFGFEREHYDLSLALGRRRLAPAVQAASPDTVLVAPGMSCRQQIDHLTGRRAAHPAEVLWEALAR